MALISIIEDFHPMNNAKLLDIAEQLTPTLHHEIHEPVGGFTLKERYSSEAEEIVLHKVHHIAMGKGENLCLDFGNHMVGYLTLDFSYTGSHPDAPAYLKLKFAETYEEVCENSDVYNGWVSRSWIQEEYVHVDVLPARIRIPRRHAFRYLKITTMDTSVKYKLVVRHAECLTETSADYRRLAAADIADPFLKRMDEISIRTLANCMQEVFEDGPKRDRRLWMGDLRLEALANYCTFRNYNLVRRCLYLFGGTRFPDGRVSANVFIKPKAEADDTWLYDYSLMFVVALEEYMQQTDDVDTLNDLYDIAMQQIEMSLRLIDREGRMSEEETGARGWTSARAALRFSFTRCATRGVWPAGKMTGPRPSGSWRSWTGSRPARGRTTTTRRGSASSRAARLPSSPRSGTCSRMSSTRRRRKTSWSGLRSSWTASR